jgi:hypothetical protein
LHAIPEEELVARRMDRDERQSLRWSSGFVVCGSPQDRGLRAQEELRCHSEEELVYEACVYQGPVQSWTTLYEKPVDGVLGLEGLQEIQEIYAVRSRTRALQCRQATT